MTFKTTVFAALFALAGLPAAADTVTSDFLYTNEGLDTAAASRLVLALNADGTIAASLLAGTHKINGFGFDALGSPFLQSGFSNNATPGMMNLCAAGGCFNPVWNFGAKLAAINWTISRPGGFTSVAQLYAGTGSANYDFFLWDQNYTIHYAKAGMVETPVPAVPLPATAPLMVAGLGAFALARRRKA